MPKALIEWAQEVRFGSELVLAESRSEVRTPITVAIVTSQNLCAQVLGKGGVQIDRELLSLVETEAAIVSVRALRIRCDICCRTLFSAALFALVAVPGFSVHAQTAPPVPALPPAAQPSAPADIIQGDGRGTPPAPSPAQPSPQPGAGDRGVLIPPPSADPGLKVPPASGGTMRVIPPPVTPGENQRVRPL